MPGKTRFTLALILAALAMVAMAQAAPAAVPAATALDKGLELFRAERYRDAADAFGRVLSDPRAGADRPEAAYWTILSYIAAGDSANAERSLDAFVSAYPTSSHVPDLLYQRGRLLYGKGDYEGALRAFSAYAAAAPAGELISSSLYWSGEALYSLGRFDEAERAFGAVVQNWPDSVKYEAASYKRSLIGLEFRERELLRLLAWSHEESLRVVEDFRRRERAYEQAIAVYQKQLAELRRGVPADGDKALAELRAQVADLGARLAAAELDLASARDAANQAGAARDAALAALEAAKGKASGAATAASVPTPVALPAAGSSQQLVADALAAKQRALDLLAFYIERLAAQEGK